MRSDNVIKFIAIGTIIFVLVMIIISVIASSRPCAKSHTEKQLQMPASMNVGATDNYGGINMPLGNARWVNVIVCDEYEK